VALVRTSVRVGIKISPGYLSVFRHYIYIYSSRVLLSHNPGPPPTQTFFQNFYPPAPHTQLFISPKNRPTPRQSQNIGTGYLSKSRTQTLHIPGHVFGGDTILGFC
jgi:hypothetical protein